MDDKLIINILKYIEDNLYDNISIDAIAIQFYFNRFYIMRLFKKETGLTITEYINTRRIIKSLKQLVNSNDRILKVALDNGYHSLEYYSEIFYKTMGYSPLEFRHKKINLPLVIEGDLLKAVKINQEIINSVKAIGYKTKSLSDRHVLQKK